MGKRDRRATVLAGGGGVRTRCPRCDTDLTGCGSVSMVRSESTGWEVEVRDRLVGHSGYGALEDKIGWFGMGAVGEETVRGVALRPGRGVRRAAAGRRRADPPGR